MRIDFVDLCERLRAAGSLLISSPE